MCYFWIKVSVRCAGALSVSHFFNSPEFCLSLAKPAFSTCFTTINYPACWACLMELFSAVLSLFPTSFLSWTSHPWILNLLDLYTGAVVFECSRFLPIMASLDPGLPKLGMMISQTRVSDAGPDVKINFWLIWGTGYLDFWEEPMGGL